ncbi:MAG: hypothetical protein IKI71_03600 [Lachnospiraceae bacterium]|nr:hypothetical protein [Lachnospiraceae bacterium]
MARDNEFECLKYVIEAYSGKIKSDIVFSNVDNDVKLLKYLNEVKPNPYSSEFPDFLSDDAIVEHFSITSSKENRKGSNFKKEQNVNYIETEAKIKEWQESCKNMPFDRNTVRSTIIENTYTDLSYNNFIDSLDRNLSHHIESLKKYDVKDRKVIFLIELQDAPMVVYRDNTFYGFYELHKDKNALSILKPYLDLLDIVVFRASDRIEIIDIKKFKELYGHSYSEEDIRGGRFRSINLLSIIDLCI